MPHMSGLHYFVVTADLQTIEDAELEKALADIPEELRFDIEERPGHEDTPQSELTPFAIGKHLLWARKPQDFTMLTLGAAMSSMADGSDRAYAIMVFCHDAFDATGRDILRTQSTQAVIKVIMGLCEKWGEDTSTWGEPDGNREQRRATAKQKQRRR